MLDLTKQFRIARLVACFGIAIHGFWVPAIPAGTTVFRRHLCIKASALRGNKGYQRLNFNDRNHQ
jgi:hypothetical protein